MAKKEKGRGKKKKNSCQEKDTRCSKKNSSKEQKNKKVIESFIYFKDPAVWRGFCFIPPYAIITLVSLERVSHRYHFLGNIHIIKRRCTELVDNKKLFVGNLPWGINNDSLPVIFFHKLEKLLKL